ncbi:MAG: acyltransferase [Bacteroidota bacterium]
MNKLFQTVFFQARFRYVDVFIGGLRNFCLSLMGMKIGSGTYLPRINVTWPHKVTIGKFCKIENDVYFKHDGIWSENPSIEIGDNVFVGSYCEFNIRKGIKVGNNSLIASGCRFIDHDHGIALNELIRNQEGPESEILIGKNVWIGCNVVVLKGVLIDDGAIVAAGAVVTKNISINEIWGGVPARKIGNR